MKNANLMISVAGIRGVVGEGLTPDVIVRFASTFGTYLKRGKVVVGKDVRITGEMVKNSVISGLLSVGCGVVDLGICPTPTLGIAIEDKKAKGGIMISASHNPIEWNALKLFNGKGTYLNAIENKNFIKLYSSGRPDYVKWDKVAGTETDYSAVENHIKRVLKAIDVEKIRQKKYTVAFDGCGSAGVKAGRLLLEELGCRVVEVNSSITGVFPRGPEPVPDNLKELSDKVKTEKAEIGFAVDPDADRLGIVSKTGELVSEEYTVTLCADFVLSRKRGSVAVNLSTTRMVDDVCAKYGVKALRTKIGEINVIEAMKKNRCVFGGEGNGGVILPDVHYGRDSLTGMGLLLNFMAETGKSVEELISVIPKYKIVKKKFAFKKEKFSVLQRKIKGRYKDQKINQIDGIKINWSDKWVHVRMSGTEPVIRIIAEAKTEQEAEGLRKEIIRIIEEI